VCGVVVEEASRKGEVTGSNHGSRGACATLREKMRDLLANGVPLLKCATLREKMTGDGCVAGQWGSSPK
jgi:hypothetical protein